MNKSAADILFPKRPGKNSFARMVFSDDPRLQNVFGGVRQQYLQAPSIQRRIANAGMTVDQATGMPTRMPMFANKARGTMSSGVYKSMSGML